MMTLLQKGEALFQEGKWQEAQDCFLEFLKENPDDPHCLNNLGVMAHTLMDIPTAEAIFRKALQVEPGQIDALLNLCDLLVGMGRREEAISLLKQEVSRGEHVEALQDHLAFLSSNTITMTTLENDCACSSRNEDGYSHPHAGLQEKPPISFTEASALTGSGTYRAAFSEFDITPSVSENQPVLLQGMAGPIRKAGSVSMSLKMQLLLLEDAHFTKILLVTADIFGFGKEIVSRVRQLAEPWGIEPEGILLNASHTHYAPGTVSHVSSELGPFYAQYANAISNTIGEGLNVLYEGLEECEIGIGHTDLRIGVNRRLPEKDTILFAPNVKGPYDTFTPFLRIQLKQSAKTLLIINHGCHPTGLGNLPLISPDFVGYMRDALKQSGGADGVMFLQGAAGSSKEAAFSGNGHSCFATSPDDTKRNGNYMAEKIASALRAPLLPVSGSFFCTSANASLPIKRPPNKDTLHEILRNPDSSPVVREWATKLLAAYPQGNFPSSIPMELQMITIGKTARFIGIPGEPMQELAVKLRAMNPGTMKTFVLGYTNGLLGYLPTDNMIKEGGYEPWDSSFFYLLPSQLDCGTESRVVKALNDCTERERLEEEPNGYGRHHLTQNAKRAFFVLSSGRCGTLTLAHLLATADNAKIWHHPQPHLIKETLLAYWGKIDKAKTFWSARGSLLRKTWADGFIHGETDHNMTPFADVIARDISEAKFLVLVRDPRHFVRSGMRRSYYQGHPWDSGRLRPVTGTSELSSWERMSPFEKVCWLWAETYRRIEALASVIGRERFMTIRFEDLVSDTGTSRQVFHFLNLTGFDPLRASLVTKKKYNEQITGAFPRPEEWTSDLQKVLQRHCGLVARQYDYDLTRHTPTKCSKRSAHPVIPQPEAPTSPQDVTGHKRTQSWLMFLHASPQSFKEQRILPSASGRDTEGTPFVDTDLGIRFFGMSKPSSHVKEKGVSSEISKGLSEDVKCIKADIYARYLKSHQHMRYAYRKGDHFVELGAYLGYYTLQVARRVGESGLALAVEMMPENYQVLCKNLQHNTPGNTSAMNVGVGAVTGTAEAFAGGNQVNGFRKEVVRQHSRKVEPIRVPCMTIDDILKHHQLSVVDLMAVQLNGTELDALKAIQSSWNKIENLAVAANYDEKGIYAPCSVADFLDEKGCATEIIGRWVYAKRWPVAAGRRHSKAPPPVFIGGCGRSGTTLLRVMLDSHPHIAAGPESELIINPLSLSVDKLAFRFDMSTEKVLQIADQSALLPDFVERFFLEYAHRQGKFRWVEKTPRNIHYIEYILHNFPNAYFVHVVRDGRDVACSLRTHPKYEKRGDQWVHSGVLNPIDQCISRWVGDVSAALPWRSHPRYLEIRYEDLVKSPEMVLRRVLESIGAPWDHRVLRHHEVRTPSRDASKFPQNQAANEPLKDQSLQRWKRELSEEEKRIIKNVAGNLLRQTGYAQDDDW